VDGAQQEWSAMENQGLVEFCFFTSMWAGFYCILSSTKDAWPGELTNVSHHSLFIHVLGPTMQEPLPARRVSKEQAAAGFQFKPQSKL